MPDFTHDKLILRKDFGDVGLPNFSKSWLSLLISAGKFPPAQQFGARLRGWWASDIQTFLQNLPEPNQPLKVLWPARPKAELKNIGAEGRKGRKAGGRLVRDLLTGRMRYVVRIVIRRPVVREEDCWFATVGSDQAALG
jgi:hypothetical protein